MAIIIPLPPSVPHFDLEVTLEGVQYRLELRWNVRAAAWFLHVMTAEGDPIIMGRKLVVSWPLLGRFRMANRPPGVLMAVDSSGADLDPSLDDLGARVQLLYFAEGEL